MVIDAHVHVSRSEHEHPWVLEFMQDQFEGDLIAMIDRVLTPDAIRPFLQERPDRLGRHHPVDQCGYIPLKLVLHELQHPRVLVFGSRDVHVGINHPHGITTERIPSPRRRLSMAASTCSSGNRAVTSSTTRIRPCTAISITRG